MVAHDESTRSRCDLGFPRGRVDQLGILILKEVTSAIEFALVVEEDDCFSERTEEISRGWYE